MCGILGIFSKVESRRVSEPVIRNMCRTISHRGPDDEGYFLRDNVGLAMRRLSIIDLVKGHQPIHNEDKTLWVISNGEIYNFSELRSQLVKKGHKFYTETDTEVIIHLYEDKREGCLSLLSGMFAFVIFDTGENRLFIARDRLGVKPLYYYDGRDAFMFSSEIKAILGLPGFRRKIHNKSLFHFFSLNYVPAPDTIFEDIKQLLPGYYMTVTKDGTKINQYWDIHLDGYAPRREDLLINKLEHLLQSSVKRMLRSDVPLGAFLSGGLDSSALVSYAAELSGRAFKTFSVGFDDDSYDESYFARLVASRYGTEHHTIVCKPEDLITALPSMVWHADNLLADPAMLPLFLVSKLAREHVAVCLTGDGGDEIFMGYPTYIADYYAKIYKKIPYFARKFIIEKFINALPISTAKLSFEYKSKKFVEGARFSFDKAHYWWRTVFSDDEKKELFSDGFFEEIGQVDSYSVYSRHYGIIPSRRSNFDDYLYADMKVWLADNNLIRVDAMSMANSLEVRVPFLDHELVEFMVNIPPELRMKGISLKYLLKKTMADRLPKQIIGRKKGGWQVPMGKWFQSDLKEYIIEVFSNSGALQSGLFNQSYIKGLLEEHLLKRRNNTFKIWGLLVFFRWYDTFINNKADVLSMEG